MQYEAIYENGQITWLTEKPRLKSARIMISILEEIPAQPQKRRHPSPVIAGKGTTLGDLVNPIVNEQDWECLK
ncbi:MULTISPECIES: hypothetical protein [Cyanophyceae]|uniref:hypothetical protein n=1 Tax=Cyanophyceae TaxID=3028117 RepID=UPI00232D28EF|nr:MULTISPECIES: hypothetical protein [Cyanophyceae]MDB9532413.1 hypothetical protein [Nodularia spumigena CS-1038]MDB9305183.1 hypothetical protein [Nodularia spumigena CS-591/12]MDB9341175.1 hypothetical protein [Nodularia spumigena CS-589/07]MDB9402365.1 hypothetical protein [Microcystis aeruginosa CS-567/02-A1]MDB9499361.1 hypothetical protein [Nodularia spumigena CS-336/02]